MAAAAGASALMNCRCSLCSSCRMAMTRKRRIGSHAVGATRRTVVAAGGLGAAGVVLVGGIAAACAATAAQASERKTDAGSYVRSGMAKFLKNELPEALEDFDAALDLRPSARPYLWQRGLCLYYLKQYEEGSRQFRDDVAVNPNDTEEAIWAFLCEAQLSSAADARSRFLTVGTDSRPVLRAAYACFRDGTDPQAILQSVRRGSGSDAFYAWLIACSLSEPAPSYAALRQYVGLWNEAEGNETESRAALEKAVQTPYAKTSGDYMAGLARVHRQQRGWDSLTA